MQTEEEQDIIRETYFDYTGNPVMGEEGFVTREQILSKDKVVSVRWFDVDGNPVPLKDETYCRVDYTYDRDNINREKYYDAEGNPVRCKAGYAIVYREFDIENRVIYEKYFDTDGFAIMLEDGAVSRRFEYNEAGEIIKTTKYDYSDHVVE